MVLAFPVKIKNPNICQPFGEDNTNNPERKNFYTLFDNKHPGIDFCIPVGTNILASFPGIVVRKEFHEGMGNVIGTRFGNIVILYAHLSEFKVNLGSKVNIGNLIGLSGETGKACTQPHLHFELRDITQPTLAEMVFDPPFNKPVGQFHNKFDYLINNKNTSKTLKFLGLRYFGNEKYWRKILEENTHLNPDPEKTIPDGTKVVIPNF